MKKRITGILICMLMFCTAILSGCSLIEKDMNKYYNTVVASIKLKEPKGNKNDVMNITKKDLIQAYNSYGYYYESYYSYSREEAVKTTLELLIKRRITVAKSEELFTAFSEAEKTYLWQETSDVLEDNLMTYVNEILGITEDENEQSDELTFKNYDKNATLVDLGNGLTIRKENLPSKVIDDFTYEVPRSYEEDKELIFTNLVKFINEEKNETYTKAYNKYLSALIKTEKGQHLSERAEDVFSREIERLYKVVYENYMIEKYEEYYTTYDQNDVFITPQQIVDLYAGKVRSSYTQYVVEKDAKYDENVKSDISKVNYFKTDSESTKFFYVSHILFKFTDEQSAEYKKIEEKKANGGYSTPEQYQNALDQLYLQVKPIVREADQNGVYNEVAERKSYETSANALREHIALKINEVSGEYQKADTFNELIYKYNQDPGMMNAAMPYVIGVDKDGNGVSSFVKPFQDAGIALYNSGNGQIGDISDLVYTENGIHVLFYAGKAENLFEGIDASFKLDQEAIKVLNSKRVNIFVNKTYFDLLYDELTTDNFSVFENLQMSELKKAYNIYENVGSYKDLL